MVLPVIQALKTLEPGLRCVLLALTTGYHKAVAAGASPLGYRDFIHFNDPVAVERWGRQLYAGNSSPDVSEAESVAYLGLNYLDLIAQLGEEGAAALYGKEGRYGFKPLHFMRKLFDEVRPDVVVATNSPRSEQAALEVAVERGIPSVGMVDLFGLDSDTYVMRPVKPDWTCVISSVVRERLINRGFVPEGVQVTGNPAFDGLFDPANQRRALQFVTEKGWQDKQLILYAGAWEPLPHPATDIQPGRSFPIEIERLLREYVRERPTLALVVRYHPGDWFEYPRHPDDPRVHFSEPPREPIHPLILASSVVVVTNSTVGLESAVGGRAVVSIENSPMVHVWFSLAHLGVAYPSPTHLDLPSTLDNVLADPRPRPGYASDGQAGRRVAQVVLKALKKSQLDANSAGRSAPGLHRH